MKRSFPPRRLHALVIAASAFQLALFSAEAARDVLGAQSDALGGPWKADEGPYFVQGDIVVPEGETLTIEAGTWVQVSGDFRFTVEGSLQAIGMENQRIVFTSDSPKKTAGDWQGIFFNDTAGASRMEHCVVEYGASSGTWAPANITIEGASDVTLKHVVCRHSLNDGVVVMGSVNPTITSCTFEHNQASAIVVETNSYPIVSGNTARSNQWNGITVVGGDIERSGTWYANSLPYLIDEFRAGGGNRDITPDTVLTVEAGTIVKFFDLSSCSFSVEGSLVARGTAEAPIVFTSLGDDGPGGAWGDTMEDGPTVGKPGDWEEITFEAESEGNVIRHCIFKYAGDDEETLRVYTHGIELADTYIGYSQGRGLRIEDVSPSLSNLQIEHNGIDGIHCRNASPTIVDCVIRNHPDDGIELLDASATIRGCRIQGNTTGIWVRDSSRPTITDNDLTGNRSHAIHARDADDVVDARNNWWGDVSGPLDDSDDSDEANGDFNLIGQGNFVTDDVRYRPWHNAPRSADKTVGLYHFESEGNALVDNSGEGREGQLHGAMRERVESEHEDIEEGILHFDGADDYASVSHDADQRPETALSVSCWLKPDVRQTASVISCYHQGGYEMTLENGNLVWRVRVGDADISTQIPAFAMTPQKWHYVTGTFDGSSVAIHLGGILIGQQPAEGPITYGANNALIIGAPAGAGATPGAGGGFYQGYLDQARISNYALSSGEMRGEASVRAPVGGGRLTEVDDDIRENTVWNLGGSPYYVHSDKTIEPGVTLTIEPGVVVLFRDTNVGLAIEGTLTANQATFTTRKGLAEPGAWDSLEFEAGSSASSFRDCAFLYAGLNGDQANVQIVQSSPSFMNCHFAFSSGDGAQLSGSQALFENCQFINNQRSALWMEDASSPTVRACHFTNNGITASQDLDCWPVFEGENNSVITSQNGERLNGIEVSSGDLTTSGTWNQNFVPYIVNNDIEILAGTKLTLSEGVMVKFASRNVGFSNTEGTLEARGVTFTSIEDDAIGGDTNGDGLSHGTPGSWDAIEFYPGSSASILEDCVIRYAGRDRGGNLQIYEVSPSLVNCLSEHSGGSGVEMENSQSVIDACTFRFNRDSGVKAINGSKPTFRNGRFVDNGQPIELSADSVPTFEGTLASTIHSANGTQWNGVVIRGGEIAGDLIWDQTSLPYIVTGDIEVPDGASLQLKQGVIVKIEPGNRGFECEGDFTANGVIITSLADDTGGDTNGDGARRMPEPGDWDAVELHTDASRLTNCEIRYAGWGGGEANVQIYDASPHIEGCRFELSEGDGLQVTNGSPTLLNNRFLNNGDSGLWIDNGDVNLSGPRIDACDFTGNGANAIDAVNAPAVITDCLLRDNGDTGLRARGANVPSITDSVISNNVDYGVRNQGDLDLLARNNYWGNPTGPFHPESNPEGLGNEVSDDVIYEPYRVFAADIPQELEGVLENGIALEGSFPQGVGGFYYAVDVPEGQHLSLAIDDLDDEGVTQVFLQRGAFPTATDYQVRHETTAADQDLFVSAAGPGRWYALVYQFSGTDSSPFTIRADMAEIAVHGVAPSRHSVDVPIFMTLKGAGFTAGTEVQLTGPRTVTAQTEIDSFNQLTATFAANTVSAGTYDVRVTVPGKAPATLPGAFEAVSGGEPKLVTNLIVPGEVGYHQLATLYVEYTNQGEVAMPAPLLIVAGHQNDKMKALLTLDKTRLSKGFWTSAVPEGFSNTVKMLASGSTPGVLQPGESGRIPIYYAGWQKPWDFSYPPIEFGLAELQASDERPIRWEELRGTLDAYAATMEREAFDAVFDNYKAGIGDTIGDFVTMLGENAVHLARIGHQVFDVNLLNNFEFAQAEGMSPVPYLDRSIEFSLKGAGLSLSFERFYPTHLSRRFKEGRLGKGWIHSWDISSRTQGDGTVIVCFRGAERVFQPDVRGGYSSPPHENAQLIDGGAHADHILREPDGTAFFFTEGYLIRMEDRNGNGINASYREGLLSELAHSTGAKIKLEYDGEGRIVALEDHHQRRFSYTYDENLGTLSAVTNPNGGRTEYIYHSHPSGGRSYALTSIHRASQIHSHFTYDALGRLASHSLANDEQKVRYAYGSSGTVTATDRQENTTTFAFDHLGVIAKTTLPNGSSTLRTFDQSLRLISEEDESGSRRTYQYNTKGNLVASNGKMGGRRKFDYDSSNRLTTITDETGRQRQIAYDPSGNILSLTEPGGSTREYERDRAGNITGYINARGQRVEMAYDNAGQLLSKTYPDGSRSIYRYDTKGRLTSTNSSQGTTTYTYDDDDHPISVTYPGGEAIHYTYDNLGRRSSMTDHLGNKETFEYDNAGRVSRITDGSSNTLVAYEYDDAGHISKKQLKDGSSVTYAYNANGQVNLERRFNENGTLTDEGTVEYNASSQPATITTSEGTRSFEWNPNGQAISEVYTPASQGSAQTTSYVYDDSGRLSSVVINGEASSYEFNAAGDYISYGEILFEHDADGNVTRMTDSQGSTTYEYDAENNLIAADGPSLEWSQTIDPTGLTTEIMENGEAYTLLHDLSSEVTLASVIDDGGAVTLDPVFGADFTIAEQPYTYSPILEPSTIDLWPNDLYPLDPFGIPSPPTIHTISELGYAAITHPTSKYLADNWITNTITNPWVGGIAGTADFALGLTGVIKGNDFVESLAIYKPGWKIQGPTSTVASTLGYLGGGIETIQGIQKNDGYLISHGLGTIGATGLAGWLGGAATATGVTVFGVAAAPIGFALGTTVLVLDIGTNSGLFGELMYQFWYKEDLRGDRLKTQLSQSKDPNQKLGPAGFGDAHFVTAGALLPYRVDFENDEEAQAPAQVVMISDPLSEDFDWSTFELTEVGFGDHLIPVPGSSQAFEWVEPMTYEGKELEVAINIGLNPVTGVISAIFSTTDTETGLPPEVQYGFLPPEDETGRGQGYFAYTIHAKGDLATGTEIRNVATITFDFGEVIDTNQIDPHDPSKGTDPEKEALVTIDADAPTSQVSALPAQSPNPVTVSWSGEDGNGSGAHRYTVYARSGNGAFEAWLENTTETSAAFQGVNGQTYEFYVVATDGAGNEEAPKNAAEATTTVSGMAEDPYDDWLATHFSAEEQANAAISGYQADPDGDGLANLVEFGLLTHPREQEQGTLPAVQRSGESITFTYQRRAGASGLSFEIQRSQDMLQWSSAGGAEEILSQEGNRETVRVTLPGARQVADFLRLEIEKTL